MPGILIPSCSARLFATIKSTSRPTRSPLAAIVGGKKHAGKKMPGGSTSKTQRGLYHSHSGGPEHRRSTLQIVKYVWVDWVMKLQTQYAMIRRNLEKLHAMPKGRP